MPLIPTLTEKKKKNQKEEKKKEKLIDIHPARWEQY